MNGETESNQYRSYLQCGLQALIKAGAAEVERIAGRSLGSNGMPLILGDMSLADGSVPKLSDGVTLAHPAGSHRNGKDVDVGYYQNELSPDNELRAVCDYFENGEPVYHCTSDPTLLDVDRTALFVAFLSRAESIRCIGVDTVIGKAIRVKIRELAAAGIIQPLEADKLCFEEEGDGRGWFYFHYNHMHISSW